MAKPSSKSIQQQIWEQKLKIAELKDELITLKYFETMQTKRLKQICFIIIFKDIIIKILKGPT